MNKCHCGLNFGAPFTLRAHQKKEHTESVVTKVRKRVVRKVKKVVKKVTKRRKVK